MSLARTSLELYKFVRDMGCPSHWGSIIAPGQEANGDNLGKSFLSSTHIGTLSAIIRTSTYNIQCHDEIRKFPQIFVFLSDRKNFAVSQKGVRINNCKLICVRAIEVWLYIITKTRLYHFDPLKPHFYIVKLGFTGVYIIFLIFAQKHRLWVRVRTVSARRF